MNSIYPARPKFFACQFVRLLTKKCVANELGADVFTLLTVVAMQEDARGYSDAVNWYNQQLMPLIGAGSEDKLDRIRKKAIAAGWLSYTPGRKGIPGHYFVTVPERHRGSDDARPTKNLPRFSPAPVRGQLWSNPLLSAPVRREAGDKCGEKPGTSADLLYLSLPLFLLRPFRALPHRNRRRGRPATRRMGKPPGRGIRFSMRSWKSRAPTGP